MKRIRDKTFCFGVQLEPNPRTWHTSRIHGAGCNSEELRGISYVRIPTFIAWETSNDKFTIPEPVLAIASKRRVTHYPKVSEKKNKCALTSSNNQTRVLLQAQTTKQRCSYELKRIYICGVHLRLLPQTSPGGTYPPSPSLLVLVRLLPWVNLGLYLYLYLFYCACMFNSHKICAQKW